jgi:thiamine biosynthesis lipoprotein
MRLLAAGLLVVAVAGAPQPALQRFEAVEPHMGTLVRVTVYAPDERTATRAFRAAFDRMAALDDTLSDYKPDSELNRLAATAAGRPAKVSADVFRVLKASQALAEETGGAFDVTQGPVIRLWREARRSGRLPDPAALREAAGRSGYRKLRLDAVHRTVALAMPGMALDVGGIGKGYAASEALEAIARVGVDSALVAVSGDLAFSGAPPGQRGWRIGVQTTEERLPGVPEYLELTNAAVSTSGNTEQHAEIDGRRYSHVIDPSSGQGLVDDIRVTVIARHGLDADGLDTAASVLGPERGLALIESHPGAAGLIIVGAGEGARVLPSVRFQELPRP